ncbi:MAG: glycosyltransferase family 2 protein, partial [Atopobiaceae bacterium]|nr:glycosyltransferase family 2 protein [Atopobiaceae bacterium]
MTVIIPVYNSIESLGDTMESLDKQTADQLQFEVVLVDDGSTDGSSELCDSIAKKRENYRVLHQANQGVSSARNRGIMSSQGDYIMFLDADDSVSPNTIESLISCFDSMDDEVNLITYPLVYRNLETGFMSRHQRSRWLVDDGMYDLGEYPFIAQTTVNICIRNGHEETPLFREDMNVGEDQYFITSLLAKTGKIGYCSSAQYYYSRYEGNNASSVSNNAENAFSDTCELLKMLIALGETQKEISSYAYALALYNIGWRMRAGKLFVECGDARIDEDHRNQVLIDLMRRIPYANWVSSPYLSDTLRVNLLNLIGALPKVEGVSYTADASVLRFDDGATLPLEVPSLVIDWAVNASDGLLIKGMLKGPTLAFEKEPTVGCLLANQQKTVDVCEVTPHTFHERLRVGKEWRVEMTL